MSLSTPTLTLKRHLLVGAVMTATLVASSTTLAATTMRIAHLNPPDPTASNSGAMTAVFKQLVETATNGEIKVEVFPAGQLGEDANVINQVGQGIVQSTISSAGGSGGALSPHRHLRYPLRLPQYRGGDRSHRSRE